MLTRAVGLELPTLYEDFDEDSLAFVQSQRIYEVQVADHLEVKYSDGKDGTLKVGYWTDFHIYDLERIMALLNYEAAENWSKYRSQMSTGP